MRPVDRIQHPAHHRISIHAPAWGATKPIASRDELIYISIHAPAWGATFLLLCVLRPLEISIHAPAWGATPPHTSVHLHGGISIHAPAWGATGSFTEDGDYIPISIHAPAWGATIYPPQTICFPLISIHAPAWGATQQYRQNLHCTSYFNPRTRVGCDVTVLAVFLMIYGFQSTHPRGVRRDFFEFVPFLQTISIHAPAWGATSSKLRFAPSSMISIHAPAWGATRFPWHFCRAH